MNESPIVPDPVAPVFRSLPPLSLYVHIPWCLRKCPYCDFNSHEQRDSIPEAQYVGALVADLELALPSVWGRTVHSVFFGGGTPSLFSAGAIDDILSAVRARLSLAPAAEVTLEANPGTFEQRKFEGFRDAGVNRLSLGVQSFDPAMLRAIGRVHDHREARAAVESALGLFDEVNVDLMFALPGQTLAQAARDVSALLEYAPPHVSLYHLAIEPNTVFHRHPPPLPDEDLAFDIQQMIESRLDAAGYDHYETSAYARRPGQRTMRGACPAQGDSHRCRHNLNYWQFGDYLGIGAGAHGKITSPGRIVREVRYKQPQQYIEHAAAGRPVMEAHEIASVDVGFEFMLNALRLTDGFPVPLFRERTGFSLTLVDRALEKAARRGLVIRDHARIAPTALGRRFLNDLQALFLPDCASSSPARRRH